MATTVVIGLSLELAGAIFLAAELLTLDAAVLAARGNTYTQSGEPHFDAQVPAARTFVGLGLLLAGFLVQIGGYIVEGSSWLALLAAAVIVAGVLGGRLLADRVLASWLYRRAVRFRRAQQSSSAA
jgi:hypothetical protein